MTVAIMGIFGNAQSSRLGFSCLVNLCGPTCNLGLQSSHHTLLSPEMTRAIYLLPLEMLAGSCGKPFRPLTQLLRRAECVARTKHRQSRIRSRKQAQLLSRQGYARRQKCCTEGDQYWRNDKVCHINNQLPWIHRRRCQRSFAGLRSTVLSNVRLDLVRHFAYDFCTVLGFAASSTLRRICFFSTDGHRRCPGHRTAWELVDSKSSTS